ncbi:MAG: NAD(P)-dependent glycerol-3-phosphate dehydrogenase [Gammaproteobacteria bacterium]|nr:NAD(P)-dependent glycerol-3-phosphate dehydrogenase [Gammaproteobacteria bacterium]MDH5653518.1 NAD(P)-dependent glycerol-3-phosphate dehydrogenase [Gammaproteobacteria bacterium]
MNASDKGTVAVLGAGSWGTALAILLAGNGYAVRLWAHRAEHVEALCKDRCNTRYLPGITLPENLQPTSDMADAVAGAELVLIVVPSHVFRQTLREVRPLLAEDCHIAWGSKGLEPETNKLLHEVCQEELGYHIKPVVISGPTFAREVAMGQPSAVTVACDEESDAEHVARMLHNEVFRAYTSNDLVGVQIGGAVKNVLAIAAGIAEGLGYGANTRAALITRALAEVMRFGVIMGGVRETFMGLAGLGDLILTATDNQSRNRRLGLALGQGKTQQEAAAEIGQVTEGLFTAREIYTIARNKGVDMPIVEQVYRVLFEGLPPGESVHSLLNRDLKPELG